MPDKRIYIAGHRGMVGSAIVRHLIASGAFLSPASLPGRMQRWI